MRAVLALVFAEVTALSTVWLAYVLQCTDLLAEHVKVLVPSADRRYSCCTSDIGRFVICPRAGSEEGAGSSGGHGAGSKQQAVRAA